MTRQLEPGQLMPVHEQLLDLQVAVRLVIAAFTELRAAEIYAEQTERLNRNAERETP